MNELIIVVFNVRGNKWEATRMFKDPQPKRRTYSGNVVWEWLRGGACQVQGHVTGTMSGGRSKGRSARKVHTGPAQAEHKIRTLFCSLLAL